MKILIVSWYFPPCSTMGALRVGKFAKYLVSRGHDVRVVCAKDQPYGMDLPVEVPSDIIFYTSWWDVNRFPAMVQVARVRLKSLWRNAAADQPVAAPAAPETTPSSDRSGGLFRKALTFYRYLTNIPDGIIGWFFPAMAGARRATRDWKPDVVFASAPPFTTLIVGRTIAKRCDVPLVVEYRDRWIEDPYFYVPRLRLWIDRKLENWCAAPARCVVTVSEPWAEDYLSRWGKPVTVCYNGFDPDDVAALEDIPPTASSKLNIVYTGILYPDRRDPTLLFEALSRMEEARDTVSVSFYGADPKALKQMIDRFDLADVVAAYPRVSFEESLQLQRKADVLLLLQWNDPLEAGNVPGKLFEYIAARRPVLGIGYENGVPARVLRERNAGRVINDPSEIADFLRDLIAQKTPDGTTPLLPPETAVGLSRPEQYAEVEIALESVAGQRG